MSIVALTGGFLSGKSTVLNMFKELGVEVLDIDELYHTLLKTNHGLQDVLKEELNYAGKINRSFLKEKILQGLLTFERLSELTHPFIIDALKKMISNKSYTDKLLVVEVPLLFEAGMESLFDEIIVVFSDKKNRLKRAAKRGYSSSEAEKIFSAQIDMKYKLEHSNVVFVNNGNIDNLIKQVRGYYAKKKS